MYGALTRMRGTLADAFCAGENQAIVAFTASAEIPRSIRIVIARAPHRRRI
jgi:hypothetical protein